MRVHSSPRTAALESSPLWATPHARRAVERAWSDPTVHRSVYVQRHCVQTHYARARVYECILSAYLAARLRSKAPARISIVDTLLGNVKRSNAYVRLRRPAYARVSRKTRQEAVSKPKCLL